MKTPGSYVDGFLLPVPKDKLEDYRRVAERAASIWIEHGALQYTECVADDMSTDFCRSFIDTISAKEGETVILAWAVFPDRSSRDAANAKIMADERMKELCPQTEALFDCKRMAFGGFTTLVTH